MDNPILAQAARFAALVYNHRMMEAPEQAVCDLLDALEIRYTRRAHPPVYTVEQARRYDPPGGLHVKNLFLRNKKGDRHFLAIFEQSVALDLNELGAHLGVGRLGMASEQRLARLMGITPGAVGPFGLIHDREHAVEVLLDARLRGAASIGFHPNLNTATLDLSVDGLLKFLAHCGNRVVWVE